MLKVCLISATTANDFQDPELAEMDAIRVIAEHAPLGILTWPLSWPSAASRRPSSI